MVGMTYARELNFAIRTAKEAGKRVLPYAGKFQSSHQKPESQDHSAIPADLKSDRYIVAQIKGHYPAHGIFTEESETPGKSEYVWRVDPLDGSNNFKRGDRNFCVVISLERAGNLLIAVIYRPADKEMLYAEKGEGTWMANGRNKRRLSVSEEPDLEQAVVSYNAESLYPKNFDRHQEIERRLAALPLLRYRTRESTSIELSDVAAGRFTAHIGLSQKPWDYAAGELLIKEAGGKFTDLNGNEVSPTSGVANIIASNGHVHEELVRILRGV